MQPENLRCVLYQKKTHLSSLRTTDTHTAVVTAASLQIRCSAAAATQKIVSHPGLLDKLTLTPVNESRWGFSSRVLTLPLQPHWGYSNLPTRVEISAVNVPATVAKGLVTPLESRRGKRSNSEQNQREINDRNKNTWCHLQVQQ